MPVLLIIILLVSCPAPARGDEFRVVPSLSVREEYNSNILLTTGDARRDFITTISPGVEIVDRTARLDADLQVRLDRLEYADNRDLNATNQTYSGRIRYLLTPLFGVSAEAAYMRL
ncbi:MAG TPA: outer membrane beta-barrel protein, partial [Thermodesulfovibrionales bacterium]|nr:outer membrane beta-barrel protein [Thermodesulfovibrionales bacterium]